MSDYLDQLISYICSCRFDDLPRQVSTRAKAVLADSIAVIASGAQEEEVKALIRQVVEPDGPRLSTVIGAGIRTEPSKAGLINGTAGTFLELDEGNQFARGHPGIHVVPAALALAEARKLSGRRLLTALVLGYEVAARIGIACKIRMSMHPHGSWGTVGAAVAVGKLLEYDHAAMREMINVSSSLTLATSRRTMLEGGLVRNVYSGISAYMGILAHQLVDAGFNGEKDGLQTVFGSVVSDTFDPDVMTDELGERFEIMRNYFKRHACCRYNHATLDALQEIIRRSSHKRIRPEDVREVEVSTYSLAAQLCDQQPDNSLAGKFSIPFAVATTIVHGHTGVSCFTPQAVQNQTARELAKKVRVVEDPKLTAMMPGQRPSRVALTLKDGTELKAEAFVNKGDFEDPYSPDELLEKYYELATPVWGEDTARKVYTAVADMDKMPDVNELTRFLAP
jgi:2-methylcitrate dehydratase PrpD